MEIFQGPQRVSPGVSPALLGIYQCLKFSRKNYLLFHLRCVKVPDVLSFMYSSLHEDGGFAPPHEKFVPMDNRQTSFGNGNTLLTSVNQGARGLRGYRPPFGDFRRYYLLKRLEIAPSTFAQKIQDSPPYRSS